MGLFDDLRSGELANGGQAPADAPADGQAEYEEARANFDAARPDIEAGKLRAYPNWDAAQTALGKLKPAGPDPAVRKKANEDYFTQRHQGVMQSGKQMQGDGGEVTTLRTATVGGENGEPGYIIPTYNPETGEVYDLEDPKQRAKAMKMVEPDIKSGKLQPYERWQDAEADLQDFYPRVIESHKPQKLGLFDEMRSRNGVKAPAVTPEQAAQVHQAPGAGMVSPPGSSPIRMTRPNVAGVRDAMQQAQVHQPPAGPVIPQDGGGAAVGTMEQPDQTMLASRGAREQVEGDARIAGRMAVELGSVTAAGRALKAAQPLAGPILKAGTTALASGIGSLLAEPIDPSEDPMSTAYASMAFSGLGDSVALGFSAARKAHAAAAGSRSSRAIPGAQDAIDQLGPGYLPSAGRLTSGTAVDTAENVVENAMNTGHRITARNTRARMRAEAQLRAEVSKYAQGASRQEIDRLMLDLLNGRQAAYSAAGRSLYRELDSIAKEGVQADGVVKLRNAIVTEFKDKAERNDLEPLIQAIDLVLGVPQSMRGIKRGIMLDPKTPIRRWDAQKPGAVVISGADTSPQMLGQPQSLPVNADPHMPVKQETLVRQDASQPDLSSTGRGVSIEQMRGGMVDLPPNAAETITFEAMNSLRSAMAKIGREGEELIKGTRQGQAKRIAEEVDNAMEVSGAALRNPEAFAAFREANAFWKDMHATFDDNVMIAMANGRPDDVFNTVFRADSPEQIGRFRKMLFGGMGGTEESSAAIRRKARESLRDHRTSPAQRAVAAERIKMSMDAESAWAKFQGRYFMRLLEQADSGAGLTEAGARGTRQLEGRKLLSGWDAFGADANAQVFPSARQRRNAQQFFRTLEITEARGTGSSNAIWAIRAAQAGSMWSLLARPGASTAWGSVVIMGAPEVLMRLMDNDAFIRWVVTSKNLKPGSEAATRAVTQAAIFAAKEGARVVGPNGDPIELTEETPRAREAKELLDLANRRGGYR